MYRAAHLCRARCPRTCVAHVAQVKQRGQDAQNRLDLVVAEHEHFHGRPDVGEVGLVVASFRRDVDALPHVTIAMHMRANDVTAIERFASQLMLTASVNLCHQTAPQCNRAWRYKCQLCGSGNSHVERIVCDVRHVPD